MNGINKCEKCGVEFKWVRSEGQSNPRFCSMKCRGHTGFIPGGTFRTNEETKEEKRNRMKTNLEKHSIRQEGCWGWKGDIEKSGYARLSCRDVEARHAHVAAFLVYKGDIPEGKQVNHLCHTRHCSNPSHLYVGTQKENMRDKILANRQARGSKNGNSKLDETKVAKIKKLLLNDEKPSVIAEMFDVTITQVYNIQKGDQWNHIEVE